MLHSFYTSDNILYWLASRRPAAFAEIRGSDAHPTIQGYARFYQRANGVFVVTQVTGLPMEENPCKDSVFAMHIHAGGSCTGNTEDPFADAGSHYNPNDCPHPAHAGDLPPLFGNNGYAWSAVFTNRFAISDIIGKTLIIHSGPDDFMTQPAGNSGSKIACGLIARMPMPRYNT